LARLLGHQDITSTIVLAVVAANRASRGIREKTKDDASEEERINGPQTRMLSPEPQVRLEGIGWRGFQLLQPLVLDTLSEAQFYQGGCR
jgi:hypothetical protein